MPETNDRKNPIKARLDEILKRKNPEDENTDSDGESGFSGSSSGSSSEESDDEPNFIKKDDKEESTKKEQGEEKQEKDEVAGVINKLKNIVWPESNQQRNLDRETGGLEVEKRKSISSIDAWDGRSEEVDRMGSTDTFNSTGVRSVVARKKRERLERAAQAHQNHIKKGEGGKEVLSEGEQKPKVGFATKIRLMRDHGANSVHSANLNNKDEGRF